MSALGIQVSELLVLTRGRAVVFLGYVGWAAGNFYTGYVLGENPTQNSDGTWTDTPLVAACMSPKANGVVQ